MSTVTVKARGEVMLHEDVLQHLGIRPGDEIQVDLLPDGRAELRAAGPKLGVSTLRGILKGKTNGRSLTLDEIGQAIAESGSRAGTGA